jgi:hypothetical protein
VTSRAEADADRQESAAEPKADQNVASAVAREETSS